jgi:hypothetical protein
MAPILTAEDVVRRIAAEWPISTTEAGSAFGSNRQQRSCGSMGSNSAEHRGVSVGFGRRNRRPSSERTAVCDSDDRDASRVVHPLPDILRARISPSPAAMKTPTRPS